jgi:uncharacterized protein YodC (DUF2158 family)
MTILKTGDVVILKSGGPKMTVQKDTTGVRDAVDCKWFDSMDLKFGSFQEESLELADQEKPYV